MITFLRNAICVWICLFLSVGQVALANPNDPAPLKQGEPAPFNGVLIPTLKAAEMTARLEQSESLCLARVESSVASAVNQKQFLLNNCESSKKIMDDLYKSRLDAQTNYSDFLEKRVTSPGLSKEWVFIIGIVAGVGITIGAGYAMAEAGK
tara:strand:- start:162 stop:614 length:453 start_codon:yes stop_codon:yes gene_type:complete